MKNSIKDLYGFLIIISIITIISITYLLFFRTIDLSSYNGTNLNEVYYERLVELNSQGSTTLQKSQIYELKRSLIGEKVFAVLWVLDVKDNEIKLKARSGISLTDVLCTDAKDIDLFSLKKGNKLIVEGTVIENQSTKIIDFTLKECKVTRL